MPDPSKGLDEFLGERLEELMDASQRAVRQARKAYVKGTLFDFRLYVSGVAQGDIVEDVTRKSGLDIKITPGPMLTNIGGEIGGGTNVTRTMGTNAAGGLNWGAEVSIRNAVALDQGEPE